MVQQENKYWLFEKQLQLIQYTFDDSISVIVYGGGIRGGKTFGALIASLLFLKKYKGSKFTVVRDSLSTIVRNTLPVYNKIKPNRGDQRYDQKSQVIYYPNTSQLAFLGENFDKDKELNRFRGFETTGFILEEFNELQAETFDKCIERAGTWHIAKYNSQPPPKIIATCNPSRGYVKERFYDAWRNGTLPKGWVFIPALAYDNPHLPQHWWDSIANLPENHRKVFVDGDWDELGYDKFFCDSWNDSKVQVGLYEDFYRPDLDIYLSFDFNILNSCTVWQHDDYNINCIKEYRINDMETLCKEIKNDFGNHFMFINGDATGAARNALTRDNQSAYELIKTYLGLEYEQFRVPTINPTHKASKIVTNVLLKNENVKIFHECKLLLTDIRKVKVENTGSTVKIDKSDPDLGHLLDTMRYHFHTEHYDRLDKYGLKDYVSQAA